MKERISKNMIGFLRYLACQECRLKHVKSSPHAKALATVVGYLESINKAPMIRHSHGYIQTIKHSDLVSVRRSVKALKDREYIEFCFMHREHIKEDSIRHSGAYYTITDKGKQLLNSYYYPNKDNNKEVST